MPNKKASWRVVNPPTGWSVGAPAIDCRYMLRCSVSRQRAPAIRTLFHVGERVTDPVVIHAVRPCDRADNVDHEYAGLAMADRCDEPERLASQS